MLWYKSRSRHATLSSSAPSEPWTHKSRIDRSRRDSRRDSETSDPLSVMRIAWQSLHNHTQKQQHDGDTNNGTHENGMSNTRIERKGDKPRVFTSD